MPIGGSPQRWKKLMLAHWRSEGNGRLTSWASPVLSAGQKTEGSQGIARGDGIDGSVLEAGVERAGVGGCADDDAAPVG